MHESGFIFGNDVSFWTLQQLIKYEGQEQGRCIQDNHVTR